jgi:hypothetical protein
MKKLILAISLCSILFASGCAIIVGNHVNVCGSESSSLVIAEINAVNTSAMSVDEQNNAYMEIAKKGSADGMREYEWKALMEAVEKSTLSADQKKEILNYIIKNKNVKPCGLEVEQTIDSKCNKK